MTAVNLGRHPWVAGALLAGAYFVVGAASDVVFQGSAVALWPATGVGLAGLLLWGTRLWPAVVVAELAASLVEGKPWIGGEWLSTLVFAPVNASIVILAAIMLKRADATPERIGTVQGVFRFWGVIGAVSLVGSVVLVALTLATAPGIALGASTIVLLAAILGMLFAAGAAVVAPPIVFLLRPPTTPREARGTYERIGLAALTILIASLLVVGSRFSAAVNLPAAFACLGVTVWAGSRFGQRTASWIVLVLAGAMIAGSLLGTNAFAAGPNPAATIATMQFFMLVLAGVAYLLGAFSDDLRATSAKLASANLELSRVNDFKSQMINMVAHDLNNLVMPMKLNVEFLTDEEMGMDEAEKKEATQRLSGNIERIGFFLSDLLDAARLQSGKLSVDKQRVDVSAELTRFVADMEPVARSRSIALRSDIQPAIVMDADARRLHQVFSNLVSNALKFTPTGGTVSVTMGQRGGLVEIAVKDSGEGMDPAQIPQLFSAFSQLGDRKQGQHTGTGLGLFICRGIVGAHGGRIWAQSEGKGRGSTFKVELPFQSPNP